MEQACAQHALTPLSYTKLRQQVGEALRPIREALHKTADGAHRPVEFMGYRFTGKRLYKAPGQIGYAWHATYHGEPITEETKSRWPMRQFGVISGGIEECAAQLHARQRAVAKAARKCEPTNKASAAVDPEAASGMGQLAT